MSFPSGHAARTAAGLGVLSAYLAGKLKVWCFDGPRGRNVAGRVPRYVVVLAPLLAVVYIALTRVQQNVHHWQDVLVGALIGLSFSYMGYRIYFPSVFVDSAGIGEPKGGYGDVNGDTDDENRV
ncbi:hypothetical protein HK104_011500 [Borealophlyctis nickersoniae]|nr:hypothetical protein HK104_011500 [Borealophlyctis nickersoniae]